MKQKTSTPLNLTVFQDLIRKQLRKEILKGRLKRRKKKRRAMTGETRGVGAKEGYEGRKE